MATDITVTLAMRKGSGRSTFTEYVELGHIGAIPCPEYSRTESGALSIKLSSDVRFLNAVKQLVGAIPYTISPVHSGWGTFNPESGTGGILVTFTESEQAIIRPFVTAYMETKGRANRVKQLQQLYWPSNRADTMPEQVAEALFTLITSTIDVTLRHADTVTALTEERAALERSIARRKSNGQDTSVLEGELKSIEGELKQGGELNRGIRLAVEGMLKALTSK